MLRTDPAYADKAARVAALARDVSEYMAGLRLDLATRAPSGSRSPITPPARSSTAKKFIAQPKELLSKWVSW